MRNLVCEGKSLLPTIATLFFFLLPFLAQPSPGGASPQVPRVNVLFLVGGGFHEYEKAPQLMADELKTRLQSRGRFEFVISKDLGLLQPAELKKYDLLMLNVCQPPEFEISAEQKVALLAAVVGGLPVVALHCTFYSFRNWPEFHQMVGAYLFKHDVYGPMAVEVVAPDHPVVAGLPVRFELTDEPDEPEFADGRDPSVKLLVQTVKTYAGRSRPEAQAWVKTFGKGKIFATTFGHDLKCQQNDNFLRLLGNGIAWATLK